MSSAAAHSLKRPRTAPPSGPQMAYLGPPGTYGEQRFSQRLGGGHALVPCANIAAVYQNPAPYLVLPLENTLHGSVIETVDSLLTTLLPSPLKGLDTSPQSGQQRARAIGDTVLRIDHQLVALKGTTMAEVQWVRSHEQALGQSTAFLDAHLPNARRVPWPSTAGAVQSLLGDTDAGRYGAAICSTAAYDNDADRLALLYSGTQAVKNNFTRFLLLHRRPSPSPNHAADPVPTGAGEAGVAGATEGYTSFYAVRSPSAIGPLLAPPAAAVAVHARPAPPAAADEQFPRWTVVEVREAAPGADKKGALWLGSFVCEPPHGANGSTNGSADGAL